MDAPPKLAWVGFSCSPDITLPLTGQSERSEESAVREFPSRVPFVVRQSRHELTKQTVPQPSAKVVLRSHACDFALLQRFTIRDGPRNGIRESRHAQRGINHRVRPNSILADRPDWCPVPSGGFGPARRLRGHLLNRSAALSVFAAKLRGPFHRHTIADVRRRWTAVLDAGRQDNRPIVRFLAPCSGQQLTSLGALPFSRRFFAKGWGSSVLCFAVAHVCCRHHDDSRRAVESY